MLEMDVKNIATFSARSVEFILGKMLPVTFSSKVYTNRVTENIVVVLALVGAFFLYAVYRQRQAGRVSQEKKFV
jgi:hypothetical protein